LFQLDLENVAFLVNGFAVLVNLGGLKGDRVGTDEAGWEFRFGGRIAKLVWASLQRIFRLHKRPTPDLGTAER